MNGHNPIQSCPIVDIHASWLALNPIHGCINACKYCFLNKIGMTRCKPNQIVNPKDAVKLLLSYELYDPEFVLCLFTSTDIFATKENIDYCLTLLDEFVKNKIKNKIVFITKCYIPDSVIKKINELKALGYKFLFLLSYSGLESNIEVGVSKNNIKENFIKLKEQNIPVVHYWRPFLIENSSDEVLSDVLNFVKDYAICSVAIGLKVELDCDNQINLWEELRKYDQEIKTCESVWTKNAYKNIYLYNGTYPIFKYTSCAVAYAFDMPDYNGFYNSPICVKYSNCPLSQRALCKKSVIRDKKDVENKIKFCLEKLNKNLSFKIDKNLQKVYIDGLLTTGEIVYIKMKTNLLVIARRSKHDYYWNSTNNTKNILII